MKKDISENLSIDTAISLNNLLSQIENQNEKSQREQIDFNSPYSQEINQHITTYKELCFYCDIGLKESKLTRTSLIRKIDFDLWVSCKNKTNRDLMRAGHPPFAFDSSEGTIELHHIGQSQNSPFAELTIQEHTMCGNKKTFHNDKNESWRKIPGAEDAFNQERKKYWEMRATQESLCLDFTPIKLNPIPITDNEVLSANILDLIKRLFRECSVDTLNYIADEAKLTAIIKSTGISSFSELLEINLEDQEKRCVHCNSAQYVLYGQYIKDGEKIQRYKCKKCERVFTFMNESIISDSNLDFPTWVNFINCLCHGKTVSETAKSCNISEKSAHSNRLRVFYALKILNEQIKLRGDSIIDEKYFPVSFKGNHSKDAGFSLNRPVHKRGSEIHTRGLSKEQVCVVCATDMLGNSVAKISGVAAPSANRIQKVLGYAFDKSEPIYIYSDKNRAIKKFAKMNGFQIKQALSVTNKLKKYTATDVEIRRKQQIINSFHSRLEYFLKPFYGISSALLSGYLELFVWIDRNRHFDMIEAYKELFSVMVQPNLYKTLEEIEALPCFSNISNASEPYPKTHFNDFTRASAIYEKYAKGQKTKDIAQEYGILPAQVNRIIRKFRKLGFGYKTEKEKREEEKANRIKEIPYPYKNSERNRELYNLKQSWTGSLESFYQMATKKYGLKTQTIKNLISSEKRIIALEKPFYICQDFKYRELFSVYTDIFETFVKINRDEKTMGDAVKKVADIYGYTESNIWRIVHIMNKNPSKKCFEKNKIAGIECSSRDKAIFIEFLKWNGTKKDFCLWASQKHNLSFYYVYHILELSCCADSKRYEMTYQYPTPRKE